LNNFSQGSEGRVPDSAPPVDLHLHSTASDGIRPPVEVVRLAVDAGLAGISLTDHDTTDGLDEAEREAEALGIRFIAGAELSATEPGSSIHLLAFGFERKNDNLCVFLRNYSVDRRRRAREIVAKLVELGVRIEYEDVKKEAGAAAPTRSHIARALITCRQVSNAPEAFRRYLSRGRPAFVDKQKVTPRTVFEVVHGAGGVVCLAHPGRTHGVDDVKRWASEGLDGVEVLHPSNSPTVRSQMNSIATQLGLLRCGGSDWHGLRTRRSNLGCENVPQRWLDEIAARCAMSGVRT
jgi:predicted metal-dependent phosphoesterase TrpH